MSKIVGSNDERHIIKPYKFKNMDEDYDKNDEFKKESLSHTEFNPEKIEKKEKNDDQKKVIENLLLKIEELSTNIVNSQKKFEEQINECNKRVEEEKQRAFNEGYEKGLKEGEDKCRQNLEEKMNLLETSLQKIDKINETFEEKILSVEKELISVALDIAKEVIQKEISKESSEIAYSLAKNLMEDIKDATKIKLKLNPKDAVSLKDKFKNIEVIPDEAVKEGGVIIISDIGNIDAEVLNRFENIKESILEGKE